MYPPTFNDTQTCQPLADPPTMRTDPPVKCIILPVCTSFRIPPQTMTCEPPPPPPAPLCLWWDGEGRGGWGAGLARQNIPKQVLYFTAPFTKAYICMFFLHTQHILFSIQDGRIISRNVAKYIAFRRRKLLQGRGARGRSSCPQKGSSFNSLQL